MNRSLDCLKALRSFMHSRQNGESIFPRFFQVSASQVCNSVNTVRDLAHTRNESDEIESPVYPIPAVESHRIDSIDRISIAVAVEVITARVADWILSCEEEVAWHIEPVA